VHFSQLWKLRDLDLYGFHCCVENGYDQLIFVDNGMKINGQYYHDALLYQQMLPAIKRVAGDTTVFQQDNAPSHHAKDTIKLLQQKTWTSLVLISGH